MIHKSKNIHIAKILERSVGAQFSHFCIFNQEDSAENPIMGIFWFGMCETISLTLKSKHCKPKMRFDGHRCMLTKDPCVKCCHSQCSHIHFMTV